MQNFTHTDLFLYYFNETDIYESVVIQKEIDNCPEVEEEYHNLVSIFNKIDEVLMGASEKSIQKVLSLA